MNTHLADLYDRLQAFSFDRPNASLPFSQRLARENDWPLAYTLRVMEEYKRFAALAVVAGHPVTPSDAVDQAWHLHLTYSRSYWEEFCPKVLQMPLHHEPTQGGSAERDKFEDWYSKTLTSYERLFGQKPPMDIWPAPAVRFGQNEAFVRVNRRQSWILPKPDITRVKPSNFIGAVAIVFLLTSCSAIEAFQNPYNFSGPEFLKFYGALSAIALIVAWGIQQFLLRLNHEDQLEAISLDLYETAYLVDEQRIKNLAIVNLVQQGYVEADRENQQLIVGKPAKTSMHPVEQALVVSLPNITHTSQLALVLEDVMPPIQQRLQDDQLLMNASEIWRLCLYPLLVIALVLSLGIARIILGVMKERPVGYLVAICLALSFLSVAWIWLPIDQRRRTQKGDRLLESLRQHTPLTQESLTGDRLLMAFALFGQRALPADLLAELDWLLTPAVMTAPTVFTGGSEVGCGTDGGGSCGGGCGGCGGGCGG